MKKIYFIRHGESEGNVGPIRQGPNTSLTQKGEQQANFVAERCTKLAFEIIISSTMKRAEDTAGVIARRTNKPIETSDLFVERRRPKEQIGKPKDDPQVLEVEKVVRANFHIPGFRFSDEENFNDLKVRAKNALDYLKSKSEKNIVVVTHGFFMRIVVAYVVFGDKLTANECQQFIKALRMENTGITVLGINEEERDNPWWVWAWNDNAHLG